VSKKKLQAPIFLNESCGATKQLKQLQSINQEFLSDDIKSRLNQEIKFVSYGIQGEKNIIHELRSSHMPIYVLSDLYFEYEGLSAQIDFIVITRKYHYVIECKNLYGDIKITPKGEFIRITNYNEQHSRKGFYSPITQNHKHMELLRKIRRENISNSIMRAGFDKFFHDTYRSVVVLANPKTILTDNRTENPKNEKVIRADLLISYIKNLNKQCDSFDLPDQKMEEIATFFLSKNIEREVDYIKLFTNSVAAIH